MWLDIEDLDGTEVEIKGYERVGNAETQQAAVMFVHLLKSRWKSLRVQRSVYAKLIKRPQASFQKHRCDAHNYQWSRYLQRLRREKEKKNPDKRMEGNQKKEKLSYHYERNTEAIKLTKNAEG